MEASLSLRATYNDLDQLLNTIGNNFCRCSDLTHSGRIKSMSSISSQRDKNLGISVDMINDEKANLLTLVLLRG
jgi:hypothetical protein